jgi:hypothetical protein
MARMGYSVKNEAQNDVAIHAAAPLCGKYG